MGAIASQIASVTIVYSTVYSDADQRKHQSSTSLHGLLGTGEFPAQMASNAENVSIWWRHHGVSAGGVSHFNSGVREDWEGVCDWLAQGLPSGINPKTD